MSTEDIDVLTREYLKEHNAHSADLNYEAILKVFVHLLMMSFVMEFFF